MAYLDLDGLKNLNSRIMELYVRKDTLANNLTTTEAGLALDARQGKALQDAVNGKVRKELGMAVLSATSWEASGTEFVQSVSFPGVSSNTTLIVAAAPSCYREYGECGVYCQSQAAGQLTFTAQVKPTQVLSANVLILE